MTTYVPGDLFQVYEEVTRKNCDGSFSVTKEVVTYWVPPNGEAYPWLTINELKVLRKFKAKMLLTEHMNYETFC